MKKGTNKNRHCDRSRCLALRGKREGEGLKPCKKTSLFCKLKDEFLQDTHEKRHFLSPTTPIDEDMREKNGKPRRTRRRLDLRVSPSLQKEEAHPQPSASLHLVSYRSLLKLAIPPSLWQSDMSVYLYTPLRVHPRVHVSTSSRQPGLGIGDRGTCGG